MHEVTCSGDLIAIFSQADQTCRKKHCQSHCQTDQDSCGCCNNVTAVDGHVSLFSVASHAPVHVVSYPDLPNPELYDMLRYKWSPDSRQLVICWRDDDHSRLDLACLSQHVLAERQVGHLQSCMCGTGKTRCSVWLPLLTQGLEQHAMPARLRAFGDLTLAETCI